MSRPPAADATVLAFDFGTRRIGVAVGNTVVRVAHGLATIEAPRNDDRFRAIDALVDEWKPDRLVVGVPRHEDGREHAMTLRAQRFARQLGARLRLPVAEVDERHTTELANAELRQDGAGRPGRAKRDEISARIILQAYFDELQR